MRPHPRRATLAGVFVGLAAAPLAAAPAAAQEAAPLYLRIRPPEARAPEAGTGGSGRQGAYDEAAPAGALAGTLADAEAIRRARAAREAVWERSNARARVLIASVCTGCMKPMPPAPVSADPETATAPRPAEPAPAGTLAALTPDPAPQHPRTQEESP
ncbi:hypothetical protein [Methylobacterium radiodurans]|uniref:hypothetical protein n=1 Tax=Methylobacterium radiodurans TaxID=2202828 RepID=UPI0019502709|nr:hypothetical protein [Methylobacterium radiodurans]